MSPFRLQRAAFTCVFFSLASLTFAACSSGGATVGAGGASLSGPGSGTGSSSGSGSGSGSATASPSATASAGSGGGTATASPGATATPTGASSSSPSSSPTSAATAPSLDTLNVLPAVVDGDLGGVAQIGVLDPNYTGPYSVSVNGMGLIGNLLQTLSNTVNGTLAGNAGGETTLTLNLANAVQLGLLGSSGDVVTICEQQNPSTCKSVSITNNGVVPMVGSSVSSIVFGPSGSQFVKLIAPALSLSGFQVTGTPQGITVTNLGNGQYVVNAAANVAVPLTGYVTFSDGTDTVNIPIAVL